MTDAHRDALAGYLLQNKQHSHGKHNYAPDNTGLTALEVNEGLRDYLEYFAAEYLPKKDQLVQHPPSTSYDVIIVGGGLSGLVAANRILENQPAATVLVLEANDRVGGRLKSITATNVGLTADGGGTFVGPTQNRIISRKWGLLRHTFDCCEKLSLTVFYSCG